MNPTFQGRSRHFLCEELVGRNVIKVIMNPPTQDYEGMSPYYIEERLRAEAPAVILAYGQALIIWEEMVELRLVFDQSLRAGKILQGPGHFAGGPQRRITLIQGGLRLLDKKPNHTRRIENAVFHISIAYIEHGKLPALQVGARIQAVTFEISEHFLGGVVIHDIDNFFQPLQPLPQKRGEQRAVFFL